MSEQSVELSKPINVEGEEVHELTLREPTVADLKVIKKIKDEMEQDLELISRMADVPKPALDRITARDFKKLQEVMMDFLGYGQTT